MAKLDFSLSGRVALITGAGRGIGLGMGRALAEAGCAVALQDIDAEVAEAEAAKIRGEGGKAIGVGGDVTDITLPKRLVDDVAEKLGGIHILVNNAALQTHRHWLEITASEIEREWRSNMLVPILLCQLAAPIFKAQRWGRIINLGSVQQRHGNPHMLPYALSKSAMENVTKALARDLAKENVTVNMISPGYFNTWRNREDFKKPEDFVERGKWIPMGRIGEPEDAAGLALLLCSEAGSYITGQTIYVDGGISAR